MSGKTRDGMEGQKGWPALGKGLVPLLLGVGSGSQGKPGHRTAVWTAVYIMEAAGAVDAMRAVERRWNPPLKTGLIRSHSRRGGGLFILSHKGIQIDKLV